MHVLPALGVRTTGNVRVGQFVDQGDVGAPGQDRLEIHVLGRQTAVDLAPAGDDIKATDGGSGLGPTVGLDQSDDDVGAALGSAAAFVEHGVRLADTGRGTEVDAQPAPFHFPIVPPGANPERGSGW